MTGGTGRPGPAGQPWLLAIDTGTSRIIVAAGDPGGALIRAIDCPAEHHHGERLLPQLEELMAGTGLDPATIAGIGVGTGPGAFTGLRVGLATAKTLAHARGLPIVGVGTGEALIRAAASAGTPADRIVLLLPAGPHDRVEVRHGATARLLPGGVEPDLAPGEVLVAVDLEGRAPVDAVARGDQALAALPGPLLALAAERLVSGATDDPAALVPEYVSLPRGVRAAGGEIEWSRDPR